MTSASLLIASGIMSFIAAYVLFKLSRKEDDEKYSQGDDFYNIRNGFNNALQILMFFLLISSLLMLGKTAFAEKDYCAITVANETIIGNITSYDYQYFCVNNDTNSGAWVYLLPLWVIRISAGAFVIYLLAMVFKFFKGFFGNGGDYG